MALSIRRMTVFATLLVATFMSSLTAEAQDDDQRVNRFKGAPIPQKTKVTAASFEKAFWDYRRTLVLEQFDKYTTDSEAAKKAARAFLEKSNTPPVLAPKHYVYLARRGYDAKSNDPIFMTFYAYILSRYYKYNQFMSGYNAAMEGLKKKPYSSYFALKLNQWRILAAREKKEKDLAIDQAIDSMHALMKEFFLKKKKVEMERRFLWNQWESISRNIPNSKAEAVINKFLAEEQIDPWFKHMLLGAAYIELAWYHRGGGFGNEVTELRWRQMHRYLGLAAKHLTAAWNLHRAYPEAATYMITVAMGYPAHPMRERDWFDRAVKAQMDYMSAYHKLSYAMWPRWHGNYKAMTLFAQECSETGRFDTRVPWYLYEIYKDIQSDMASYMKKDVVLWENQLYFETLKEMFEKQLAWDQKHLTGGSKTQTIDSHYKLLAALSFSHGDMVLAEQYINKPTLMKYDDLKIFKIKDMKAFKALRKNKGTMHDQLFRQR